MTVREFFRRWGFLFGCLLALVVPLAAFACGNDSASSRARPRSEASTAPGFLRPDTITVDGVRYLCILYLGAGLWCERLP